MPLNDFATDRGPATAGIWSIDGDGLRPIERFDVGPAIVLVPSEAVLLLTADLPLPTPRRRFEALPFAIEDRVAVPIGSVHCALGEELAPQRHLAGVVDHAVMAAWSAMLAEAGLDRAALVPDALALPVPPEGAWSVDLAAGRALVRLPDGTGFALPAAHLESAWETAGRPRIVAYGELLPFAVAGDPLELAATPLAERLLAPALDLRQGRYAPPRRSASPLLKRIAIVAAIGVVAHGAIATADTLALDHIASQRAAETRALIAQVAPTAVVGEDVAASAEELLPTSGAGPSQFLPLLSRVATALKPLGAQIVMRSVNFDAAQGTLSVEIEAADIAGLQKAGGLLTSSGLNAMAGAASQDQGKAVGAFLIKGAA
ncbi:general secretion pathway protein L [Sphingomonas vulcanisoli]|uniref:General secretion pathway protein L n=1 Tax=Sphingomonas vulcanisoli TaxID=1658060 RepID=A0ABX0TTW6_9SPHN|nr:type II secretion system protein GspL [Sphingomonas vulcanisoli]NIJ07740.1 general secretion pathway protein L [Sphingomonas vulcanisoli]